VSDAPAHAAQRTTVAAVASRGGRAPMIG
jgi:hypothetical protein